MVSIVVVFPRQEDARNIRNLLMRSGYDVAGICTSGAQALQIIDGLDDGIVVCGYKFSDMLYSELADCLPPRFEMLLVASAHVLCDCRDNDIVCLELPLKVHDFVNTLEMMAGNLLRSRKKAKLKPKGRSEEEKKVIDSAKKLLMERNNMTEEEAHRYIQKCSMDSGRNLLETARMVFSLMKF
ncbi:ANTAR domain-containing response regulator [Murimonas intestini]|uniref:Response regulator NasT n=1 Tax=Murimonas intestini TaxID=1337051 RepID=A0AB73SXE3_9FIRM|nr:response regulator [Murimonas intestini]MCR1843460.1 response regulator [Murimonas intestini]MCR1868786.1 response regulator [Murimonas intestini]MCR1886254.1 response regulator [Murimonas intestini]